MVAGPDVLLVVRMWAMQPIKFSNPLGGKKTNRAGLLDRKHEDPSLQWCDTSRELATLSL